MARPLRIEYDGALYHLTSRGNEQKPIFRDDADRKLFLNTLFPGHSTPSLALPCLLPDEQSLSSSDRDARWQSPQRRASVNGVAAV
jgi:hypothetical protein